MIFYALTLAGPQGRCWKSEPGRHGFQLSRRVPLSFIFSLDHLQDSKAGTPKKSPPGSGKGSAKKPVSPKGGRGTPSKSAGKPAAKGTPHKGM